MVDQDQLLFRLGIVEGLLTALIAVAITDRNEMQTKDVASNAKDALERVRNSCPLHLPKTDQQ